MINIHQLEVLNRLQSFPSRYQPFPVPLCRPLHHRKIRQHEDNVLGPDAGSRALQVGCPHVAAGHFHLHHPLDEGEHAVVSTSVRGSWRDRRVGTFAKLGEEARGAGMGGAEGGM